MNHGTYLDVFIGSSRDAICARALQGVLDPGPDLEIDIWFTITNLDRSFSILA